MIRNLFNNQLTGHSVQIADELVAKARAEAILETEWQKAAKAKLQVHGAVVENFGVLVEEAGLKDSDPDFLPTLPADEVVFPFPEIRERLKGQFETVSELAQNENSSDFCHDSLAGLCSLWDIDALLNYNVNPLEVQVSCRARIGDS